ncbi:transposase InsO family protein [Bradyrhizobium sp. LM3.2]
MRRQGIRAIMARPRRVRTTDSRHDFPIAPNLIERNFSAAAPNRIWLADITYIETDQGWLYLATVMDLYSRKIVGWAMGGSFASRPAANSLADGHFDAAAWCWPHPPLRSRRSCLCGLPQAYAVRRLPGLDEPQGAHSRDGDQAFQTMVITDSR